MWQRKHSRQESGSNCVLFYTQGACGGTLGNVSLGGAFIKVLDGVPDSLKVGNKISLMLFKKNNINFSDHTCRIVRCNSFSMGVSFLEATPH